MKTIGIRRLFCTATVGLMATAGFAMAQDTSAPPAPTTTAPITTQNGGWRRVGDSQNQNGVSNSSTQDQGTVTSAQTAPQPNYPQAAYPPPQANYPAQNSYPASNYPQQQQPYPQQQQPYPQQQQPYPQQQQPYPQTQQNGPYQPQYPMQQPQQQAPVPAQITVPAGTYLTVRVNQQLSSDHNQVGDAFSATLARPIVANGVVVAEPGQTVGGRVTQVQKSGRVEGLAKLGVELTDLTIVDGQNIPLKTTFISRTANSTTGRDAAGIAGTTGVGAAIGAAAGWGRGAAIGAGAGAAVGIIGVLVTRGQPSVIFPEQVLTFRLEQPLTIATDRSPQAFRYVQPGEYDQPPAYASAGYGQGYGYPAPGAYPVAPYAAYPYYAYGYGYPYYPYYGGFSLFIGRGYYGPHYFGGGFRGGFAVRRR